MRIVNSNRATGDVARGTLWQRWLRRPQQVWLRRALFQVHLWSGIALGLYVFFISATGSMLVYRNELAAAAIPEPPAEAGLALQRIEQLMDLHDNLLSGRTGRAVNGAGAIAVMLMCLTGIVMWWPGITRWRESLTLHRGIGWRRFTWQLHGFFGIWSVAFLLVLALSGMYLCFPGQFDALGDWLEPMTATNAGNRFVDKAFYWLAYLHFGRINGIGIPCDGPGLCDQVTKATWAFLGAIPALLFVTGVIMWCNRVVWPWRRSH